MRMAATEAETIIRNASVDDLTHLSKQLVATQKMHVDAYPDIYAEVTLTIAHEFLLKHLEADASYLQIAEDHGDLAGYSFLDVRRVSAKPFTKARSLVYLNQVVVTLSYRRKGIGRALISDVLNIANGLGIDRVELDVWELNEEARAFFADQGLTIFGYRMFHKA